MPRKFSRNVYLSETRVGLLLTGLRWYPRVGRNEGLRTRRRLAHARVFWSAGRRRRRQEREQWGSVRGVSLRAVGWRAWVRRRTWGRAALIFHRRRQRCPTGGRGIKGITRVADSGVGPHVHAIAEPGVGDQVPLRPVLFHVGQDRKST